MVIGKTSSCKSYSPSSRTSDSSNFFSSSSLTSTSFSSSNFKSKFWCGGISEFALTSKVYDQGQESKRSKPYSPAVGLAGEIGLSLPSIKLFDPFCLSRSNLISSSDSEYSSLSTWFLAYLLTFFHNLYMQSYDVFLLGKLQKNSFSSDSVTIFIAFGITPRLFFLLISLTSDSCMIFSLMNKIKLTDIS